VLGHNGITIILPALFDLLFPSLCDVEGLLTCMRIDVIVCFSAQTTQWPFPALIEGVMKTVMQLSTKHNVIWQKSGADIARDVVCATHGCNVGLQVRLSVCLKCIEPLKERLIEAFCHPVAHRMVQCCSRLTYASKSAHLCDQLRCEISALVAVLTSDTQG